MSKLVFNTATPAWEDVGASLALADAAVNYPKWTKYTKTFTDLSTAATTNNIELFSLLAKEVIHGVIIKTSVAFSGGAIATYTLSVGIAGTLAKYAAIYDAKAAVSDTNFASNVLTPGPENFGSATSIKLSAISTIGNLNAATQGSVDVFVLKSTLP